MSPEPTPISSEFIDIQDCRIRYLNAGNSGSPVVLLHGGGSDSALLSWGSLIAPLAERHCVYAPDLPGYGESARPDITYSLEYYIGILAELLQTLGIERATLIGLSMGGGIALGFTLRYQYKVEKLVLVDSYSLASTVPAHILSYLFTRMPLLNERTWSLFGRSRALVKFALRYTFHDPGTISGELLDAIYAELQKPGAGRAFLSFLKSEVGRNRLATVFADRLDEITVPTLIVHGEKDFLVPVEVARTAHNRIEGSQFCPMEGCGHWPQRERPEAFNRAVMSFLQDS